MLAGSGSAVYVCPRCFVVLSSILSNSFEIRTVKSLVETYSCSLQIKQGNAGVFLIQTWSGLLSWSHELFCYLKRTPINIL